MRLGCRQSGARQRGSTMVAVFWLMSILGIAVFSVITLVKFESDLVASQTQGTRARHLAEMGIAVGANPVVRRDDPILRQVFEGGGEGFSCQLASEADKIDINYLLSNQDPIADDKGWLRELFFDWGLELTDAQDLVDALVDWVDAGDTEELNGAEAPYYENLGFLDRPFNRPFYNLDEMKFVRGFDLLEAANPNWKDWFTIWTQSGLDVNEASADKIARVLNVSIDDADVIPETVRGADGILGTDDDQPFQSVEAAAGPGGAIFMTEEEFAQNGHRITVNSPTVRIESTGWSGDVKRRVTIVIRNREGNPTLLERREEIVQ
ncbi:general secretion pathway protein GspK [Roseibacillus ishigakijimensis]|uniref:General secretion pathway protein GspK n=1 Tax=Roseibacillus ishigakijimensis TaxID=454146 RepID=A0A934RN70_9BACT|nr:type II secretion system protein GspK [Roseibacillus ishigakijimensis]MBK1833903.1 general secretion pathway protein GspK [Roseibacillus ishigakijimensis]